MSKVTIHPFKKVKVRILPITQSQLPVAKLLKKYFGRYQKAQAMYSTNQVNFISIAPHHNKSYTLYIE